MQILLISLLNSPKIENMTMPFLKGENYLYKIKKQISKEQLKCFTCLKMAKMIDLDQLYAHKIYFSIFLNQRKIKYSPAKKFLKLKWKQQINLERNYHFIHAAETFDQMNHPIYISRQTEKSMNKTQC
ncbi:unnamed protein product [Paramecium pentaurelia]|uniref:Uncharacterized protein n=1 Tax=Paramecium pentaurelia TaxID=43138 RepID=A0A8S1VKC5_9CILI|nr:unnamed protein product [Paramecium pentaurelia]